MTEQTLGKFNSESLARTFSARTTKRSVIVLGDDGKFWVVTMAESVRLYRAGYEVLQTP